MKKKEESQTVMGYHMMCPDGFYIIGLDYDDFKLEFMIPEIKRLQEKYNLSSFHIIETSKGHYHAVCFDKVSVLRYRNILLDTHADEKFKRSLHYFGEPKVLRITGKGKFRMKKIKTVLREEHREQSTAHKLLYDYQGIIKYKKFKKEDNKKDVSIVFYTTKKK